MDTEPVPISCREGSQRHVPTDGPAFAYACPGPRVMSRRPFCVACCHWQPAVGALRASGEQPVHGLVQGGGCARRHALVLDWFG
jgi:hypothetical protein